MHNRPKLKNRKSQKPTASLKEQEEVEAKVQAYEELTAVGENLGNGETGEIDAEEASTVEAEKLEESNASSFFNDSSLGDYDFEEKEPEVGNNTAEEDAAVDEPVLSKEDEVGEGVNANETDQESKTQGEEEEGPSKGAILAKLRKAGAMNVLADFPPPKEDQERKVEEEGSDGSSTEKTSGTLDLKASEYFTKYPKAIANPQVLP